MRLSRLLATLPPELVPQRGIDLAQGDDPVIRGIAYDSRAISPGDLFVALKGEQSDGHTFIDEALALGCAAVLVEEGARLDATSSQNPIVAVADTRKALAWVASQFYGEPSRELQLVGVTGTNGKTSITYLVESILAKAGRATGLLGTVEIRFANEVQPAQNTTPESLDLQRLLRSMLTRGTEVVVMEVSSHGPELGRVTGCAFGVAAFTNLTQDHLDFHGDMDSYLHSKIQLFERYLTPQGTAVINIDDPASEKVEKAARDRGAQIVRTTRHPERPAEVRLLGATSDLGGSRARMALGETTLELEMPLVGDFNLENLAVACGIAMALDVPPPTIAEGVRSCEQVPGRMERVEADAPGQPVVLVDHAHTPDAIDKLLGAARPLARGRLITLFGCGGDRDRTKRPLMARAVARHSDLVVATSDNPRTEPPAEILHDVEAGLDGLARRDPADADAPDGSYFVIEDRREAIAFAIALGGPEDLVVLAGKGHEDYQIQGREKLPFDDRQEAARHLTRAVAR